MSIPLLRQILRQNIMSITLLRQVLRQNLNYVHYAITPNITPEHK